MPRRCLRRKLVPRLQREIVRAQLVRTKPGQMKLIRRKSARRANPRLRIVLRQRALPLARRNRPPLARALLTKPRREPKALARRRNRTQPTSPLLSRAKLRRRRAHRERVLRRPARRAPSPVRPSRERPASPVRLPSRVKARLKSPPQGPALPSLRLTKVLPNLRRMRVLLSLLPTRVRRGPVRLSLRLVRASLRPALQGRKNLRPLLRRKALLRKKSTKGGSSPQLKQVEVNRPAPDSAGLFSCKPSGTAAFLLHAGP